MSPASPGAGAASELRLGRLLRLDLAAFEQPLWGTHEESLDFKDLASARARLRFVSPERSLWKGTAMSTLTNDCPECGRPFAKGMTEYMADEHQVTCGLNIANTSRVAIEDCWCTTIARLKARVLELESWRPLSEESKPQPGHFVAIVGKVVEGGHVLHWIDGDLLGPKGSCWWYQLPRLPDHMREFER